MSNRIFGVVICALGPATLFAQSGILEGPFVPGSGSYSLAPKGDSEATDSVASWSFNATSGTILQRTNAAALNGSWGLRMSYPNALVIPGQAFGTGSVVGGMVPGQQYVLSGFFRAEEGTGGIYGEIVGANPPRFSLDSLTSANAGKWYFGWVVFTQSAATIANVRIVRTGPVVANSTTYFDDLAVTPLANFTPPTVVPEPASLAILGVSTAVVMLRRRKTRQSGSQPIH